MLLFFLHLQLLQNDTTAMKPWFVLDTVRNYLTVQNPIYVWFNVAIVNHLKFLRSGVRNIFGISFTQMKRRSSSLVDQKKQIPAGSTFGRFCSLVSLFCAPVRICTLKIHHAAILHNHSRISSIIKNVSSPPTTATTKTTTDVVVVVWRCFCCCNFVCCFEFSHTDASHSQFRASSFRSIRMISL